MSFKDADVAKLLADCHRRCSICHRFCGVKMELDHIQPRAEDGSDEIGNAIPVCFNCHAETHLYNDRHPRGRKFKAEELRLHKQQWLEICAKQPGELVDRLGPTDVGPLQGLVDELQFNKVACSTAPSGQPGLVCPFEVAEFDRALTDGLLSLLADELRSPLLDAYVQIKAVNAFIVKLHGQNIRYWYNLDPRVRESIRGIPPIIDRAIDGLVRFLGTNEETEQAQPST